MKGLALNAEPLDRTAAGYRRVRRATESICGPLLADDYQVQSIAETSPPKWHLAHVTWFFETFVLRPFSPGYAVFHPRFDYLFNSYYQTVGDMHPRPQRGLLSRPGIEEVYAYRAYVDEAMLALFDHCPSSDLAAVNFRAGLGLQHEQQHQELLYMDIKRNFWANPLRPTYRDDLKSPAAGPATPHAWHESEGGVCEIGYAGGGFAFDNEMPRHRQLLAPHRLGGCLVTNGEYLEFMEAGGYLRPEWWLSDGWATVQGEAWRAPLYWEQIDDRWWQFGLAGMRPVDENEPVVHVSYYEADAYARWRGCRLPLEVELEFAVADEPVTGNFADSDLLHPAPAGGGRQWYGDAWEWTGSAYRPYPGFVPLADSMGEYNGKFMCNQMVLRGGCCVTPQDHARPTYRNFFYAHDRWPFAGIRLAADG